MRLRVPSERRGGGVHEAGDIALLQRLSGHMAREQRQAELIRRLMSDPLLHAAA
ncbi:hypothetical protein [Caulobacter sp. 17J80-11]|uniref:hypothetical protein n=1 Tax=Caulobacter sp. 17J80-11 TaxID=2763502 RepID=UPI001653CE47|nr:hypothetical protein [Caulobacter sp. 17J80-11]MBC6982648.1 hypothetical protein [Caulobacter sp. 17J80-11]